MNMDATDGSLDTNHINMHTYYPFSLCVPKTKDLDSNSLLKKPT